jgi:dihydrofolate reductase
MGRIIVSENVSLDGVVQDPTGEEGFKQGGWFLELEDKDREEWAKVLLKEALGAEALLLGRRSDEWFAVRWLSRSGEWADRLNSLPKYVVSSTLEEPRWTNSTDFKGAVLKGDVVTEVSKLKQEVAGDIVVYASTPLVHTLMEHDLVDELRLIISRSRSGPASASSARPATRSPCASSRPRPSVTFSRFSPTSSSETPSWRSRGGAPPGHRQRGMIRYCWGLVRLQPDQPSALANQARGPADISGELGQREPPPAGTLAASEGWCSSGLPETIS